MKYILAILMLCGAAQAQTTNAIAHRPDLTPEPVFFQNELLIDTWRNSTTWLPGQLNGSSMTDFSPEREDAGILSKCAKFDGTGDFVTIENSTTAHVGADDFTVTLVADLTTTGAQRALLSKWTASTNQRELLFHLTVAGAFQWIASVDGSTFTAGTITAANIPQKITEVVINRSGTVVTASFDGGTPLTFSGSFPATVYSGTASILVGAANVGTANLFDGIIARAGICCSAFEFDCTFTESSGTRVHDVTGNGNHGTATITSSEAEFWGGTQTNSPYAARYGASRVLNLNGQDGTYVDFSARTFSFGDPWIMSFKTLSSNYLLGGTGRALVTSKNEAGQNGRFHFAAGPRLTLTYDDTTTVSPVSSVFPHNVWVTTTISNNGQGTLSITVNGVNTDTAVDTNKAMTVSSFGGQRVGSNVQEFFGLVSEFSIDGAEYTAANAYGTTLPDNVGTNDATLVNVDLVNIPALLDGTASASTGLDITNPGGLAHNNGGYSLIFGGATNSYANLVANTNAWKSFYTNDEDVAMVSPSILTKLTDGSDLINQLYLEKLMSSMPFDTWTNSFLWLTAESPVLNAGTTTAEWLCYAKTCAGNATQTVLASQPTTIVTNGVRSLSFDGGDFLSVNNFNLDFDAPFSVSLWVKKNGAPSGNFPGLLSKGTGDFTSGGHPSHGFIITDIALTWSFRLSDDVTSVSVSAAFGQIEDGLWHHFSGTWDGLTARSYTNGVAVQSSSLEFSGSINNSHPLSIGRYDNFLRYFNGEMSDIFILQKQLTQEEINTLYDAGKWRREE